MNGDVYLKKLGDLQSMISRLIAEEHSGAAAQPHHESLMAPKHDFGSGHDVAPSAVEGSPEEEMSESPEEEKMEDESGMPDSDDMGGAPSHGKMSPDEIKSYLMASKKKKEMGNKPGKGIMIALAVKGKK